MELELTLSGMGILIKNEAKIIKKTLEEVGYEVEIEDKEPTPSWFKENNPTVIKAEGKVKIILDHQPWGG